jgi:hypothetical protein
MTRTSLLEPSMGSPATRTLPEPFTGFQSPLSAVSSSAETSASQSLVSLLVAPPLPRRPVPARCSTQV